MERRRSVAVIGAGPAGLCALKELRSVGLAVTAFEQSSTIGGVWSHMVWDEMRCNLSKHACAFRSFPWPPTADLFPSAAAMREYLREYASANDLWPSIRLDTHARVQRADDGTGWQIHWTCADGSTGVDSFDLVCVASGFFSTPRLPNEVAGVDAARPPVALHSSAYRSARALGAPQGGTVLVVGGSFSGAEIAAEIARAQPGVRVLSSVRTPHYYLPRLCARAGEAPPPSVPRASAAAPASHGARDAADTLAGQSEPPPGLAPIDELLHAWADVCEPSAAASQPPTLAQRHERIRALALDSAAAALPWPETRRPVRVAVSSDFVRLCAERRIEVVGGLEAVEWPASSPGGSPRPRARFADGRVEPFDRCVLATGFTCSALAGLLPADVLRAAEYEPSDGLQPLLLLLHTLHPGERTLGFVGMYKGPHFPAIELQARWLAALWTGACEWPSEAQRTDALHAARAVRSGGGDETTGEAAGRAQFPADHVRLMLGLARQLGIAPMDVCGPVSSNPLRP